MKLHLPKMLTLAVMAAASLAVSHAAQFTVTSVTGTVVQWTGEGASDKIMDAANWGNTTLVANKQWIEFNTGSTVNLSKAGDFTVGLVPQKTTERCGIYVTGNGTSVTMNEGAWVGSIIVDTGASLDLTLTGSGRDAPRIQNNNGSGNGEASVYVNGTLTLHNTRLSGWGNNSHQWLIGTEGLINLNDGCTLKDDHTNESILWDVQAVVYTGASYVNRTRTSETVQKTRTLINTPDTTSVASLINSISIYDESGNLLGADKCTTNVDAGGVSVTYAVQGVVSMDLTWNGGADGVWSSGQTGWNDAGETNTTFINGDSVTFGATTEKTNITVAAAGVSVDQMTVNGVYEFSGGNISAKNICTNEDTRISIGEGSHLIVSKQYTANGSNTHWDEMKKAVDLIAATSGKGELVFSQYQEWQPGWDATHGEMNWQISFSGEKNVVFEKGLVLCGAYGTGNSNQSMTLGTGTSFTVEGANFENRRMTFTVDGGSLKVKDNDLVIGYDSSGNYPAVFNLNSGSVTAKSVLGQSGNSGNKFNMEGGTLTITGSNIFGRVKSERGLAVNITGGTIESGAENINLNGVAEGVTISMGGVAFDVAASQTIKLNSSFTQTGTITKKGAGTLALASGMGNSLTEGITVEAGTLSVENSVSLAKGTVSVASGAILAFSGDNSIDTNVTLASGAKLAVNSGKLTLNNSQSLAYGDISMKNGAAITAGAGISLTADGVTYKNGATITASKDIEELSAYSGGYKVSDGELVINKGNGNATTRILELVLDGSSVTTETGSQFTNDATLSTLTANAATQFTSTANITGAATIGADTKFDKDSTLGGATTVNAGKITANAKLTISDTVTLASGTSIEGKCVTIAAKTPTVTDTPSTQSGPGLVASTGDEGAGDTPATVAKGEVKNVTIGTTSLTGGTGGGSIKNADVALGSAAKTVSGITFTDSDINLASDTTVAMSDVVFGAGTTVSGTGKMTLSGTSSDSNTIELTATSVGDVTVADGKATMVYQGLSNIDFGSTTVTLKLTQDFLTALQLEVLPDVAQVLTIDFTEVGIVLTNATIAEANVMMAPGITFPTLYSVSHDDNTVTLVFNEANAIPEPATATLSLLALAGLAARRRRKH